MSRKKVSKGVKRRLNMYLILGIIIVFIGAVTIVSNVYRIYDLKKEEEKLNQRLDELHDEEKELSSEIGKLKDPEYIAKYAREKFYYTKDGEYVIKLEDKDEPSINDIVEASRPYYIIGLSIILLTLFILFIKSKIKKNKKKREK